MSFLNTHATGASAPLTEELLLAAMKAVMRPPDAPPPLRRIYATHSVPYGHVYRMYATDGVMVAYVNRGHAADLPRVAETRDFATGIRGIHGIPVFNE